MTINEIPEELTKDFSELELKIADALMTYTKNRTQQPDPLYYQALCNAAQQMFVQLEEFIVAESFEEEDENSGNYQSITFDIREFKQMGIASYIEAKMLEKKIVDAFIEAESSWAEKIDTKYNFLVESDISKDHAIENLMLKVNEYSQDTSAVEFTNVVAIEAFGRFLEENLDKKTKNLTSWNEKDAADFFKYLKGMQPAWANEYRWHIASLDLYEWFCLKNNLTFHQFRELYDISVDDEDGMLCYRCGAYALRYPSKNNTFLNILSALQKYAGEHPYNPHLKFVTYEDTLFMDDNLKPVEELAILGTESFEQMNGLGWHYRLRDKLESLVNCGISDSFTIIRDTAEIRKLYELVCHFLKTEPMLTYTGRDGTPEFDKETEEKFCRKEDEQENEYRKNTFAWVVITTLDPFYDCMKPDTNIEELYDDLVKYADDDVTNPNERWILCDKLTVRLSDAFEEKLAEKLAYDIFVRLVNGKYHWNNGSEGFLLKLAIARDFAKNGAELDQFLYTHDENLTERLQKVFAGHPLIANKLLARINQAASAVFLIDRLRPISHHYFLAETVRVLFDTAREYAGIGGYRVERYRGGWIKMYAMYSSIIDELYRRACRELHIQPCVDFAYVM